MNDKQLVRKNIRLVGFDYSNPCAYFITICVAERKRLLCKGDTDYVLSSLGEAVERYINDIPLHYDLIHVDKYVIMPDHIHLLLSIYGNMPRENKNPPNISNVIRQFKCAVTKAAGFPVWQGRFYDHICRNDRDYGNIWEYIDYNPYKYTNPEAYEEYLKKNGKPL